MTRSLYRIAAALLLLLAAGCGARQAETRDPNMIVCGWIAGPQGLNPYVAVSSASNMIDDLIFTPLVDLGANMLPQWSTSLASSVVISDAGTRYILHLRHGVRWSDGVPLTAQDVVFTIELGDNPDMLQGRSADFALMRSVRALDRHTVEIRLSHSSPPFLVNALGETLPLPKHVLDRYPPNSPQEAKYVNADAAFSQNPVISGPWRLLRNVPDSYLILAPNPWYWGPKPTISRIAFRVYPEQDSLYAAVDAGEVDVTDIPPNLWRIRHRLRGDHKFVNWPWDVTFILLPNYHDPAIPWIRDSRVKQAITLAINRRFIVSGIMNGQADILNGPIPSFSPYYNARIRTYAYDPQKARAILDADGWHMHDGVRMKDGRALRISLKTGGATDAVASDVAELIQANLKAIGIDCTLDNEEIQTFFNDLDKSRFQVALRGIILTPYPDDYKWYYSTQTRENGGYNLGYYSDPQIDAAIEDARTAPTLAASRAALDRYQQLAAVKLPVIYLFSNRLGAVVPKDLTGYELTPQAPAAMPMGLQFWRLPPRAP